MRNTNLDVARILALLSIVTLHVDAYYWIKYFADNHDWWLISNAFDGMSRWAVPVFFMSSGLLLLSSKEEVGQFYRRRFTRILYPFVFWSSLYYFSYTMGRGESFTLYGYTEAVISDKASYHLWFIYSLIGVYLINPFIRTSFQLDSSNKTGTIFVIICFAGLCFNSIASEYYDLKLAVDLEYFYWPLGYFILGHLIGKLKYNKTLMAVSVIGVLGTFLVTVYLVDHFTAIRYGQSGDLHPVFDAYLPEFPLIFIQSALIFYVLLNLRIISCIKSASIIRFISWLAKESYGVYLIHVFFLNSLKAFAVSAGVLENTSPIIAVPFGVLSVVTVSYIAIYLLKKLFGLLGLEKIIG